MRYAIPDPIVKTPEHAQQPPKSMKILKVYLDYVHYIILIRYSGIKKHIQTLLRINRVENVSLIHTATMQCLDPNSLVNCQRENQKH